MNEFGSNLDDPSLRNELYVFSPTGGISLNINPKSLPQNTSQVKFELIGTNPLIKTNKGGNFSEYDHYIEDPTNPEIKSAVLGSITCIDGRSYIKKDGIDLIYCSFEAFNNSGRAIRMEDPHVMFYLNMLLMYSPELRYNTLHQYFDTIYKIMENEQVSIDLKYLLTNKVIEVEWEKCNFGKYSLFKNFFSIMKKFYKASPMFTKNAFTDEVVTKAYEDVLIRTLNGRAFAITKFMVESEEPLNLLILSRTIEWFQKLEGLKILTNFNENYFIYKARGNIAVEFVKQMYGKAPIIMTVPPFEAENGVVVEQPKTNGKVDSASLPKAPAATAAKKQAEIRRKSSDIVDNRDVVNAKAKASPAPKPQKKEEVPVRITTTRPRIDEEEFEDQKAKPKKVKTERIATFFSLLDQDDYESDFGGRVSNFLKKAVKMGYELVPEEETQIEQIITKFLKEYTAEQRTDISRNYKKFCLDFDRTTNSNIVFALDNNTNGVVISNKVVKTKTEEIIQVPKSIEKKEIITQKKKKSSDEIDFSPPKILKKDKIVEQTFKNKPVIIKETQKENNNFVKQESQKKPNYKEVKTKEPEITDHHIIYCNNISPMSGQITNNKRLFERASRIHEDLERILNKKFAYLKVTKIGSIGCGYATSLTNNFNMALFRKDLTVKIQELELLQDVFSFLQENYFKADSNAQITVKFDKQTILFVDKKETELICSIVFDKENIYNSLTQKIKLLLSAQPSVLHVFYKLQNDLQAKSLLKQDGISSYLLMIMLITSCQLEFQGKKYFAGLKENNIHLSNQKIEENELLKRFTTIFQNCIQQEVSRNYYFSILNGCLCDIASSKSHYRKNDCLVYLEDPFQTEVNCSKNLTTKDSDGVIQFIQNLYSNYGI